MPGKGNIVKDVVWTHNTFPVALYGSTSKIFDVPLNVILDNTMELRRVPTVDSYRMRLTAGHGVLVGDNLAAIEENGEAVLFFGEVLAVDGRNVDFDTPINHAFDPDYTTLFTYDSKLNVDGSTTRVIPNITNFFKTAVDIGGIVLNFSDTADMTDDLFGGIAALSKGIVLRKKLADGEYINYWNVKNNEKFGVLAFDRRYHEKPYPGSYGMTVIINYSQEQHNSVIRLLQGEAIEIVIQDDLTGLSEFSVYIQGNFLRE